MPKLSTGVVLTLTFEACHEFLGGDQDIEKERRDIDFSECLDLWPELSKGDQ